MNVVAKVDFYDIQKGIARKSGEEFVVSRERFDEMNSVGYEKLGAPLVEEIARDAQVGKETPESRAAKAPSKRRSQKKAE